MLLRDEKQGKKLQGVDLMGNRIIFEASIDTSLFRRSIAEMKDMANSFFDMAEARASVLSDMLGNLGNNFNQDFSNINGAISEGQVAVNNYNSALREIADTIVNIVSTIISIKNPIIGELGRTAHFNNWPERLWNFSEQDRDFMAGAFRNSHVAVSESASRLLCQLRETFSFSNEAIRAMAGHWDENKKFIEGSTERTSRAVRESYEEMTRDVSQSIFTRGRYWSDADENSRSSTQDLTRDVIESYEGMADEAAGITLTRGQHWSEGDERRLESTEDANKKVIKSFMDMAGEIRTEVFGPLEHDVGEFHTRFEKRSERSTGLMGRFFRDLARDVSSESLQKMDDDSEGFFKRFRGSAEETCSAALKAFDGLPEGARRPFNGVISFVNGMAGRIAQGLNPVIAGINALGFDLPGFLGGGSFRPNLAQIAVPRIPYLARGGIVTQPTLAMVGERGKEAVMPLENNTGWITDLANTIGSVVAAQLAINQGREAERGLGMGRAIQLNIDGVKVAETIMDDFIEVAEARDVGMRLVRA